MEKYTEKICPFCKTEITEFDAVKVCSACGIPHHEGCWNENHGCATFGCSEQHYEAQRTKPTNVCANCGTPLGEEDAFCPKCGTPKAAPKKNVCQRCGNELQEGQGFCPVCGQPVRQTVDYGVASAIDQFNAQIQQKKNRKRRIPVILGAVGAVIGVIALVAALSGPKVERITLDQSSAELRTGESITVECEIAPDSASDVKVEWSTDDARVATVKDGVITAKDEGSCTVTAEAGGKTASVQVEVYTMKEAERRAVGVYSTVGFFDENDELEFLSGSFGSLTLRSDLTGEIEVGSTETEFTWWLHSSDDDSDYFLYETKDGGKGDFFMGEDFILVSAGDYTLVFE